MGSYSIKDLEKISGIKAHTIRIWEQRYQILSPNRTETNIRLYNDDQLKKLLNVKSLLDNGMKISKISALSQKGISEHLDAILTKPLPEDLHFQVYINDLISSGLNYAESQFEKTLSNAIVKYGFYKTYRFVVYPLLYRIGLMWGKDEFNPAQEHFVSNIVRQKLFTAIDGISVDPYSDKVFILFLPENEDHEIGLLFANYLLRNVGYRTIYLGQRVPFKNLKESVIKCKPTHLFTIITVYQSTKQIHDYLRDLTKLPEAPAIYASGTKELFTKFKVKGVSYINSLDEFESELL